MRAAQNILCQGRGSAANSAVCYVLGITSVDPTKVDLLFERFISKERLEPPDIDVDFEHSRREEVMQYVYRRYGRHRAAHHRHRHSLPAAQRDPRRRQGAGADRGRDRRAGRYGVGKLGRAASTKCRSGRPGSIRKTRWSSCAVELADRADRVSAPSVAACRRLCADAGPARHLSCRSATPRWTTAPSSNGTRTISTRWA